MIANLWSTPFLKSAWDGDLREELVNHILQSYPLDKPPSDFGHYSILDDGSDVMTRFREQIVLKSFNSFLRNTLNKEIEDWASYELKGWLTGTGKDYSLNYHNHSGAQISSVFYLLCEEGRGGSISFTDPRQNSNRGYDSKFSSWFQSMTLNPKSGDIVVFPSFVYHDVSSYQGNIRLAMPVDLYLHSSR